MVAATVGINNKLVQPHILFGFVLPVPGMGVFALYVQPPPPPLHFALVNRNSRILQPNALLAGTDGAHSAAAAANVVRGQAQPA